MIRLWQETALDTHLFYEEDSGLIIGHLSTIPHTKIWVARVIHKGAGDINLGQYISRDKGQKAIQTYWEIQDRTLLELDEHKI